MEAEKTKYRITLNGCDDSTSFEMDMTEQEAELFRKASDLSIDASQYGCMPTMSVTPVG